MVAKKQRFSYMSGQSFYLRSQHFVPAIHSIVVKLFPGQSEKWVVFTTGPGELTSDRLTLLGSELGDEPCLSAELN